mgnify:CR=1 FL=1
MIETKPRRKTPTEKLHEAVQMQLVLTRLIAQLERRLVTAEEEIEDATADIMAPELPPSEWKEDYYIA